jgi:oligopeptide/dipeptide ABC transporter ATP-binding protein
VTSGGLLRPGPGQEPTAAWSPACQLLSVRDLTVEFRNSEGMFGRRHRVLRALDGLSLDLQAGQSIAVVGESGSGKTTLGRVICRLQRITAGQVLFRGQDVRALRGADLARFRRSVQIIFQDPYASLDPRIRVGSIIAEPLTVNRIGTAVERRAKVADLLDTVGLPRSLTRRFPHELSGGQRQRVAIARALALSPQLIIADEPTSALDVSAQAQVLSLLDSLRRELSLSLVYITHNLPTAAYVADRAAVMYLGRIIESGPVTDVLLSPRHPYTVALCTAAPTLDSAERAVARRHQTEARGEPPDPASPPAGCRFHPRCWFRPQVPDGARCAQTEPETRASGGHGAACHFSHLLQEWTAKPGCQEPGRGT